MQVYSWFLGCHKACVIIGVVGYALLILEGTGLGMLVGPWWPDGISLMLVWYGLYYGVLGRDMAEVAGDRMVQPHPIQGMLLLVNATTSHVAHFACWLLPMLYNHFFVQLALIEFCVACCLSSHTGI